MAANAQQKHFPTDKEHTFFWTDSEVVLHWLNKPAKCFKAYVAHRVGEIQRETEPRQWLHVPTAQNPADIGTRPVTVAELRDNKTWWEGPEFLKKPMAEWPKSKIVHHDLPEDSEMKTDIFFSIASLDPFEQILPSHFSSGKFYRGYWRCVRRWAYLLRAVECFQR